MNYRTALQFLDDSINYEITTHYSCAEDFDLTRIRAVLACLDNPDTQFRSIIIAGTNGKGSTTQMLARMMRAHDVSVGVFTSPHILDVRERIVVNGELISARAFSRAVAAIQTRVPKKLLQRLTYFERLTVVAVWYFAECGVSWALLEVGLGGRLDATNVVDAVVSVITPISRDHEDKLGNTLGKIAREKAGVIKAKGVVVTAPQDAAVTRIIRAQAKKKGASCVVASSTKSVLPAFFKQWPLYQCENARVALSVLAVLEKRFSVSVSQKNGVAALAGWSMPGRFETIARHPRIIVDGAHNEHGVLATVRAAMKQFPQKRCVCVLSVAGDKAVRKIAKVFVSHGLSVVLTRNSNPRSLTAAELAGYFPARSDILMHTDSVSEALRKAVSAAGTRGVVVCVGSFYLVSDIKKLMDAGCCARSCVMRG